MFIGLNPSTADETKDDPTIRRCIRFASDWGFGGLVMTNLYAYRATNPIDMRRQGRAAIGESNDEWLVELAEKAGIVVAAWGANVGPVLGRDARVRKLVPELRVLGLTKHGFPRHPLYMKADSQPALWPLPV